MKTENHFFDNFAVRIIIAVLTSALGVLLIWGIVQLCFDIENEGTYIEIFEISGLLIIIILLVVCVRHKIGICLVTSLLWLFLVVMDEYSIFEGIMFVNPLVTLMDIDVSVMIAIIRNEKLKTRIKGKEWTATEEKSEVNAKIIKATGWNCLLSIVTPYILVRLSDVFSYAYEITNAQAMGIFTFVLVSYVFLLMIQFVVCKRQGIFLWNYGYILLVILFMSDILSLLGYYMEDSGGIQWVLQYTSWSSFTAVAFVELLFTVYVNCLRSKRKIS